MYSKIKNTKNIKSDVRYCTIMYDSVRYRTIWYAMVQYRTISYNIGKHGFAMDLLWLSYCFHMISTWISYNFHMVFIWCPHGFHNGFDTGRQRIGQTRMCYGYAVAFIWCSHDFYMDFIRFSYGVHMVMIWFWYYKIGTDMVRNDTNQIANMIQKLSKNDPNHDKHEPNMAQQWSNSWHKNCQMNDPNMIKKWPKHDTTKNYRHRM